MRCGLQSFFDSLTDSVFCSSIDKRQILNANSGGSTTMFTLGFLVGIVLSPFRISVTLLMHHVNVKIPLKLKTDYRLKECIPVKIVTRLTTGRSKCYIYKQTAGNNRSYRRLSIESQPLLKLLLGVAFI